LKEFRKLPDEISFRVNKVEAAEKKISNMSEKNIELTNTLKDAEEMIDEINTKIKDIEDKLFSINSTKEFEALQKETGDLKRKKLESEDLQLKTMEEIDYYKKEVESLELNFENELGPLKDEVENLKLELSNSEEEIHSLEKKRNEMSNNADEEILKIYNRLLSNNTPPIISEIESEICGHCNMRIPPQTFIKVLQASEIVLAPCCKKIIIPKID
jgi:predicted  nucleic acid-binding Zn-ribbon protein